MSRFMRTSVASAEATFNIAGLPFGSYYAAAVAQLPNEGDDAWQDAAFLESLALHASTFTISEGQKRTLSLPLTP